MKDAQIEVGFFTRRARGDQRSIEGLFGRMINALGTGLTPVWRELPYYSEGVWNRLRSMWWARRRQSDVNHIVGDVHFLALVLDPQKTILTIHDCGFIHKKKGLERWIMKKVWLDLPVSRVSFVTTVSENSKNEIVELTGCDPRKVRVIYNFVTEEFEGEKKKDKRSDWTILHIGTKENKNLEGLISAIVDLNCRLVVVGRLTGDQIVLLRKFGINYENYIDLQLDQLTELYRSADMLSCVSFEEGFGLPIIEAQKAEIPVVTSRLSAMPEVAGSGALYVDPYDSEDIRRAIERLMSDAELRSRLVESGNSNVKRFTLERAAGAYSGLYHEVAGK